MCRGGRCGWVRLSSPLRRNVRVRATMERLLRIYRNQFGDASRRRLTVCLLLSICIHTALVVRATVSPRPVWRVEPPLSINLILSNPETKPTQPVATTRPEATRKPKAIARVERTVAPARRAETPPAEPSTPRAPPEEKNIATNEPNPSAAVRADEAPNEVMRSEVQTLLLADLRRYFEYPLIARRRGWEGVVRLSVTVQPDGELAAIRIVRSSGYDVLDRSAVAALQRIGQFAQAGERLHGRPLELPLSIVYRLTN